MSEFSERPEPMWITRAEAAEAIRAELGIPVTLSAINKAASLGYGPRPATKYGKTFLYEKAVVLKWARSLLSSAE
jgi:hypothetical protein